MKTCLGTGSFQRVYLRLLLCCISLVVFTSSVYAFDPVTKTINACHDCHGSPVQSVNGALRPVDYNGTGAFRNITTGAFIGNHQTHVVDSLSANSFACTPCHGPAPSSFSHRDGRIDMRLHINSTNVNVRGYYNKPVGSPAAFFNQTSVPQLSTCNNVNCHFRTTTPAWGTATLTAAGDLTCGVCHNSSGGSGSTIISTGSHTKHVNKIGNAISTCATCHPNNTTYSHATSAKAGRSISVSFATGTFTNGAYSAGTHAAYPNYFTTSGYGSCTSTYCHSSAQSTNGGTPPAYKVVTWGQGALACNSCHGNTVSDLLSGTHSKHLNATYSYSCSDCHGTGYSASAVIEATHVNNSININVTNRGINGTYSGGVIPQDGSFGTCNNTNCHGKNSGTWGSSVSNQLCTECHGQPNVAYASFSSSQIAPGGAGVDTGGNTAATSPRVGAHQNHMTGGSSISGAMKCGECHFTHTTIQDATHLNFTTATVTYQNAWMAKRASHTPSATRVSGIYNCSNVYCHQGARVEGTAAGQSGFVTRTNPVWNDTALVGGTTLADSCTNKCHGLPPNAATSGDTHFNRVATTFSELASNCGGCHSETLNSPNPTNNFAGIFKDKSKHVDGTVQAAGGDCNSCHHYDTVGSTFSGGKWTGGTWGQLNLGNYSPVSEGWGAHAKHINFIKTRLGITVALNAVGQNFGSGVPGQVCGTCHTNTGTHNMAATGGTDPTGRQINFNDNTYTNGTFSVIYGSTNPQYNGTSGTSSASAPKTCSNVSCHYFTTPLWSTY